MTVIEWLQSPTGSFCLGAIAVSIPILLIAFLPSMIRYYEEAAKTAAEEAKQHLAEVTKAERGK